MFEDINVTIDGIILYCDESISALQLGNGYTVKPKLFTKPFSLKK